MNTGYWKRLLLGGLLGLTGLFPTSGHAGPLDHWQWLNPLPSGNSIHGIVYANGRFVSVGHGGTVQFSTNGLDWISAPRTMTNTLNGIRFGNGQYVAVGDKGVIVTSPDGSTWTRQASGTTNNLLSLAYGDGFFVVGATGGTVLSSTNGTAWTLSSAGVTDDLTYTVYGNGKFLMPVPTISVVLSTNGRDWVLQKVLPGAEQVQRVTFANGRFLAHLRDQPNSSPGVPFPAYYHYASTDGVAWNRVSNGRYDIQEIFPLNNQFVEILGDYYPGTPRTIRFSSDGQNWRETDGAPLSPYILNTRVVADAAYGNGTYILVGNASTPGPLLVTSTDGTNWNNALKGSGNTLVQLAASQDKMVAVGSAGPNVPNRIMFGSSAPILVSTNGATFSPVPLGSTQALTSVASDGTGFVAVGLGGALQRSTNGLHWITRPAATVKDLAAVCRGGNLWVAVGVDGTISTSGDGLLWTLRPSGTSLHLFGITHNGSQFVAVGELGTVLSSPDGVNWTGQYAETLDAFLKVSWGNGRFVAMGEKGLVATSPDGQNWTVQPPLADADFYGISFGHGQFLTAGIPRGGLPGERGNDNFLFRSVDGITWELLPSPTYLQFNAVAFMDDRFWLGGLNGSILKSDALTVPAGIIAGVNASGHSELTLNGGPGQTYVIQTCTNLYSGQWTDAGAISNAAEIQKWVDTNSPASPTRFYRITRIGAGN